MRTSARFRYALLGALLVWALAFQIAISVGQVQSLLAETNQPHAKVLADWIVGLNLTLLTPFACLLVGFYVAGARIWDLRAWLLLAVLVSFSVLSDGSSRHDEVMRWPAVIRHGALIYRSALIMGWPVAMLLFAIYFPERADFDRRRPAWKWVALGPGLAAFVLAVARRVAFNEGWTGGPYAAIARADLLLRPFLFYGILLLFLAVLAYKLRCAADPDERRRLRVLFLGLGLSLVPALGAEAVATLVLHQSLGQLPAWMLTPALMLFLVFPMTLAYVTVVQRALGARDIVRQGVQYALARHGVLALQTIVTVVMVLVLATLSGQGVFLERLVILVAGLTVLVTVGFGARRLALWIDRSFFREAYNAEQVLNRLADSVASIVELQPLLSMVSTSLSEALHVEKIAVFLKEPACYRAAFLTGAGGAGEVTLPEGCRTVQTLGSDREPVRVYFEDPRSWVNRASDEEWRVLAKLDSEVLLPLARHQELIGFLSLGPKHAEAPYSARDLNLLQSVGLQTALAVDNSRLASKIAAETAEREVMRRELSIAREVQQLLFPQVYPDVPGIAYSGTCRPAREVGGDYYDFFELPNRALGLAIGDIAGKGIPASLLMASLQASLRSQTMAARSRIDTLMANINQLVYAASPSNRYATFFYAEYEPAAKRLTYVNAGHNAPLLLRGGSPEGSLMRLEASGPPVGLLPHSQYQEASVELRGEDLLVLFTDGISEAMNAADEEWGEERLLETLRTVRCADPGSIIRTVFAAADAFTGDAPQHDDMTLAVFSVRG